MQTLCHVRDGMTQHHYPTRITPKESLLKLVEKVDEVFLSGKRQHLLLYKVVLVRKQYVGWVTEKSIGIPMGKVGSSSSFPKVPILYILQLQHSRQSG